MFANPKAALGFAGVTLAIAIGASFAAGSFLEQSPEQETVVAENEASDSKSSEAPPAQASGWSDDGFADDWNDAAVDASAGNDFASSTDDGVENDDDNTFGSFEPRESRSEDRSRTASASSRGSSVERDTIPAVSPVPLPGSGDSREFVPAN